MKPRASLRLLAFDLGASSGRAMLGDFDGERLELQEIYRFANGPVRAGAHLYSDVLYLWAEMLHGLEKAASLGGAGLSSVGVDTWGVDFALLDTSDNLLANPFHYRDPHTRGTLELAQEKATITEIYTQTGNQLMEFNTLFQLLALQRDHSPALAASRSLLMLPDLFHFWLCGQKASEFTSASTSQCYNPIRREWAWDLLQRFDLPTQIFQSVLPAGTRLGSLQPWITGQTGCPSIPVILPAGHDTGSAVAAVPVSNPHCMYISSGTWSLIGVELAEPLITERTLAANLANEGGVGGRTRLLKITPGMWLLQECRSEWARRRTVAGHQKVTEHGKQTTQSPVAHYKERPQDAAQISYAELTALAAQAQPFGALVNVNSPQFLAPGEMTERIRQYCLHSGQQAPETVGEITRCILESLALEYHERLVELEGLLGYRLEVIHIIGGGSRNALLNQLSADLCGRQVIAGPVEATVAGNLLVQAMGLGKIASLDELRQVMRRSFALQTFDPHTDERWQAAVEKYRELPGA